MQTGLLVAVLLCLLPAANAYSYAFEVPEHVTVTQDAGPTPFDVGQRRTCGDDVVVDEHQVFLEYRATGDVPVRGPPSLTFARQVCATDEDSRASFEITVEAGNGSTGGLQHYLIEMKVQGPLTPPSGPSAAQWPLEVRPASAPAPSAAPSDESEPVATPPVGIGWLAVLLVALAFKSRR